jgi:hypothetical protein
MTDLYYTQCENAQLSHSRTLFDKIPEYQKILNDLSKGGLNGNFSLNNRKSKLSRSLEDILFDQNDDELSYLILFMESKDHSNYVKFLLDLNNFKRTILNKNTTNSSHNFTQRSSLEHQSKLFLFQLKKINHSTRNYFVYFIRLIRNS